MLPTYLEHCSQLGKALDRNYKFVGEMIGNSAGMFENSTISDVDVSSLEKCGTRLMGSMITSIQRKFNVCIMDL